MRAISFSEYGAPSVLSVVELVEPQPGPAQIRVAVRAAGVNPLDWKQRSGIMPLDLPSVPGAEVAGTVDAVGADVTDVVVGDEVVGWSISGGYAEYATLRTYVAKPSALSWSQAVSLPVAGEAARRGLAALALSPGETLLVNGASGGVGSIAVQLAVQAGVTVIGTAGPGNQDYVASLGARATTYGAGLVQRVRALAPKGVDAVLDAAGHGVLPDAIDLTGGTERVVTLADPVAFDLGVAFSAGTAGDQNARVLAELVDAAVTGRVSLSEAVVFPLTEAAEAQRVSEAGTTRGKIVLTP
ncbi:NADP-dependent oxidoreductase [Nocardiopsis ansamitocini]|uniref:NADPH:quinone reductase n=1 Tax=Nocardiopsis ansamitocini TaxID=1670832 RepID=A0A9W6UJ06_9ACTN|nr:NADP-dependent oxidoreductase [Nocardiopsis ansamitocini]GLU48242.1 NADPH:quinone reductase [Nocardiopsis ansamitocini]